MRNWLGLAACLALGLTAKGADAAKPAKQDAPPPARSQVTAVTVYQGRALVTRVVDVLAGNNPVTVTVAGLPTQTIDNAVTAVGIGKVRVLKLHAKRETPDDPATGKTHLLSVKEEAERLATQIQAAEQNLLLLAKLENFTSATLQEQTRTRGKPDSAEAIALTKFVTESRLEQATALSALRKQWRTANDAATKNPAISADKAKLDVTIVVEDLGAKPGQLVLRYQVAGPTWTPRYEFRAQPAGDPVLSIRFQSQATVTQKTGEDWPEVELTLATADLLALPNALDPSPWEVKVAKSGDKGPAPAPSATKPPAATPAPGWPVLTFRPGKFTIHDGDPRTIELESQEIAARFIDHYDKAVPALAPGVVRLAELKNPTPRVLLPGAATISITADPIGTMDLPLVVVGGKFTLNLGIDPRFQVGRELIERSNSTQGSSRVQSFNYRIKVVGATTEPVKMQVWDRLPHTDDPRVAVDLVQSSLPVSLDPAYWRQERPKGLLRWDIVLPPGMQSEDVFPIDYRFRVESSTDATVEDFPAQP